MTNKQWTVIAAVTIIVAALIALYYWAIITVLNYFHMPFGVLVSMGALAYLVIYSATRK